MHTGAIGVVKSQDSDGDYRVDFLEQDNWCAGSGDIEIDPVADQVRPGARCMRRQTLMLYTDFDIMWKAAETRFMCYTRYERTCSVLSGSCPCPPCH